MIPEVSLPIYDIKIPSTGQIIKIRPFLVKEEKILLMALESKDENEIINTTRQVVQSCILSEGINIDKLPFFDVDYLFIALRAKSVGESIDIKFTCSNLIEPDKLCNNIFSAKIDIANVGITKNEDISTDIKLSATTIVKMKYPNYAVMKTILDDENNLTKKIRIIAGSIAQITDKDKVYTSKDFTKEEIIKYIENLTQEQFKKLEAFVDNFPTFFVAADAQCPKCGFNHHLEYTEFTSFFV